MEEEQEDRELKILRKRVEEMGNLDKTGLSLIDIMEPYSNLYHYITFKFQELLLKEQNGNKKENNNMDKREC